MRESEIQRIISLWTDYLHLGEKVSRGRVYEISLTKEQLEEVKQRCIAVRDEIIDLTALLEKGKFEFEFDPSIEDAITIDVTNTPVPNLDPAPGPEIEPEPIEDEPIEIRK